MPKIARRTVESQTFTARTLEDLTSKAPHTACILAEVALPALRTTLASADPSALLPALLKLAAQAPGVIRATGQADFTGDVRYSALYAAGVPLVSGPPPGPTALPQGLLPILRPVWDLCALAMLGHPPNRPQGVLGRIYRANPAPLLLAQALRDAYPGHPALDAAVAHLRSLFRQQHRHLTDYTPKTAGTLEDKRTLHCPVPTLARPPAALRREVRLRRLRIDLYKGNRAFALYDPLLAVIWAEQGAAEASRAAQAVAQSGAFDKALTPAPAQKTPPRPAQAPSRAIAEPPAPVKDAKHPTTPWPHLFPTLAAHPRRPRLPERLPDYGVLRMTLNIGTKEVAARVLFRLDNMKALEVQEYRTDTDSYHRVRQPERAHARNQIKDQNIHANYPGMARHREMPHWAQ